MTAYLKQAPIGFPGDITRADESNVEPAMLVAASGTFASKFGIPVKYVSGGIQQFSGGAETKASFACVLIPEVLRISVSSTDDTASTGVSPLSTQLQGLLVRGYCVVKCVAGTPARGGTVYVQIVANGGAAVGDFRADGTDSGNAVALDAAQAEWASDGLGPDGYGNTNIAELRIAR